MSTLGLSRRAGASALACVCLVAGNTFAAQAADCSSPLAGRVLSIDKRLPGFGSVQGLPRLPLLANEYVVTIDDGPDPRTTAALSALLRDSCVKATFFFIGSKADKYPDIVRQVVADGHGVGSHSYTHPDFGKLDDAAQLEQMVHGAASVSAAAGSPTRLARVPGSSGMPALLPGKLVSLIDTAGLAVAGYDISPEDWRNSPPADSMKRLLSRLGKQGVIVFHDGQSNTLALIPLALEELKRRGAAVVSLGG